MWPLCELWWLFLSQNAPALALAPAPAPAPTLASLFSVSDFKSPRGAVNIIRVTSARGAFKRETEIVKEPDAAEDSEALTEFGHI